MIELPMLNMLLDGLIVVALLGLWWMWVVQFKQRKRVEILLAQATSELQESSRLLTLVMQKFPDAAQLEVKQHDMQRPIAHTDASQAHIQRMNAQDKAATKKAATKNVAVMKAQMKAHLQANLQANLQAQGNISQRNPSEGVNFSAQIMRLQREGNDAQRIADMLAVPVAQVRLMLLLQAPKV